MIPASLLLIAASPHAAVEAAYLSKLPPFVKWPRSAFESPAGPLNICVVGADPFGAALDRMVSGQRVGRHPIAVKRLSRFEKNDGCHVLWLGALKGQELADALAAARGAPVLTVTDGAGDQPSRAMVDFDSRAARVSIAVDSAAAQSSGLVVSSKLLSLADAGRAPKPGGAP